MTFRDRDTNNKERDKLEVLEAYVRFDALSSFVPGLQKSSPTPKVIPGFSTHLSLLSSGQEIACDLSAQ